jgi:hypothetical protein
VSQRCAARKPLLSAIGSLIALLAIQFAGGFRGEKNPGRKHSACMFQAVTE